MEGMVRFIDVQICKSNMQSVWSLYRVTCESVISPCQKWKLSCKQQLICVKAQGTAIRQHDFPIGWFSCFRAPAKYRYCFNVMHLKDFSCPCEFFAL